MRAAWQGQERKKTESQEGRWAQGRKCVFAYAGENKLFCGVSEKGVTQGKTKVDLGRRMRLSKEMCSKHPEGTVEGLCLPHALSATLCCLVAVSRTC